jgi:hypothetical protein
LVTELNLAVRWHEHRAASRPETPEETSMRIDTASSLTPGRAIVPSTTAVPLTAGDRCDACGAQAYLRATMPGGSELLFCGHHGAAHRPSLLLAGARLHDETDKLRVARASSAAA